MIFPSVVDFSGVVVTSFSDEGVGLELANLSSGTSGVTTWPAANRAIYVPLRIGYPLTIAKMFWSNGATVGTNNVDVGVYDSQGNRLVSSGSTLTSGASAIQSVDVTDTVINPGLYYIAMAMDGTTDTVDVSSPGAPMPRALGVYQQASAFALPSTATFAVNAGGVVPLIGITGRTVV